MGSLKENGIKYNTGSEEMDCAETPQILRNRPPIGRYSAAVDLDTEYKMDHSQLEQASQGMNWEEPQYYQLIDHPLRIIESTLRRRRLIQKLKEEREKLIQLIQEQKNTSEKKASKSVQDITSDTVKWNHQVSSSHQSTDNSTSFQWLALKSTEKNATVMILNGTYKHQLATILRYNICNYKVEVQLEDSKDVVIVRCDDICMYSY